MRIHITAMIAALVAACASAPKPPAAASPTSAPDATGTTTATEDVAAPGPTGEPDPASTDGLQFYAIGPVASVDGVEISADVFNREIRALHERFARMPAAMLRNMKNGIVDQLVDKALLDKVLDANDVQVSEEEVDAELEHLARTLGGQMESLGINREELRREVARSMRMKRFLKQRGRLTVSDADVRKQYDEDPQRFDEPEKTRASHILLKLDRNADAATAQDVERRAEELTALARAPAADFAALAREHSEGPTGPKGGDLGYFKRGVMVPAFEAEAWRLKPGEVSDPVRTQFGYHVLKVFDRTPAVRKTFSDVEAELRIELEARQMRTAATEIMQELREVAHIELFFDNIVDAEAPATEAPGAPSESM